MVGPSSEAPYTEKTRNVTLIECTPLYVGAPTLQIDMSYSTSSPEKTLRMVSLLLQAHVRLRQISWFQGFLVVPHLFSSLYMSKLTQTFVSYPGRRG